MPYINPGQRKEIDKRMVDILKSIHYHTAIGELNYMITQLCLTFINEHGCRYETISKVKGVLADVSDEITRRLLNPYEDTKIEENGDLPLFIKLIGGIHGQSKSIEEERSELGLPNPFQEGFGGCSVTGVTFSGKGLVIDRQSIFGEGETGKLGIQES